ncbi:response regulator [Candidatus Poribacteria bacterium]|nr:response regulator [Candidatus Poribacteria bacterium]
MEYREGRNNRVLVVDDQEEIHQDFEEMLNPGSNKSKADELASVFESEVEDKFLPDFEIIHARSGREAFEIVKKAVKDQKPIAVAYMDVRMPPGWDGVETTRHIREIDNDIEIVIMTAYTSRPLSEIVSNIKLLHKLLYVRKPFAREEIQQMTIALVEKWNIGKELEKKNRQLAKSREELKAQLDNALAKILGGFLPICAGCKKIRDEEGNWNQIDVYLRKHTEAEFTYSICPDCKNEFYSELYDDEEKKSS